MTPRKLGMVMAITLLVMAIIMCLTSCTKGSIQVGKTKEHGTLLVRVQAISTDEKSAAFSETSAYNY